MLKNEIIIINTSMPLRNYMKRRPTHYAEILLRNNRIINVSWAPLKHYFRFKNTCKWEEKIFFRIPGNRLKIIQKLNKILYGMFLGRFIKRLSQKPILWHFYSGNYDIVKFLPNKISVLEICDDTPEFFYSNPKKYEEVKKNEDKMTKSADFVFTISDNLMEKKKTIRPDIKVIRNGVVYEDFANTPNLSLNPNDELFNLKPPIVGYFGAVSKWFDFDLVEGIADKLNIVNFIFVGRISPEQEFIAERLNAKSNIHFFGEKPYKELPHYLKYCNLCHIPFISNDLVACVNPIKLYEYLAAGKRVVSTPLPEVIFYRKEGLVETASGIEDYIQAIKRMLAEKAEYHIKACQNIGRVNTWESRVETACKIVKRKINN